MFTEVDKFVIDTALQNQLINEDVASQIRDLCQNNQSARALDLIRENALVSKDYLSALVDAVDERFGQQAVSGKGVTGGGHGGNMYDLLAAARELRASDLHVNAGAPPTVRINGQLEQFDSPPLSAAELERLLESFLPESEKKHLKERFQADFSCEDPKHGRFRVCAAKHRLGYGVTFRLINPKVPAFDSLGLPQHLKRLMEYQQGLVLVTGPVGSGKSTTMAALLEEVNVHRHDHIITIEDPIEYVFEPKGCQITQREIPTHSRSFATALRASLREDPDVIMVGEMRDLETISLAITAAETGHLVIGTLHTNNAPRTIDRVLDVFPPDQQGQIRTMVSESLRGVISQQLVPKVDGKGRALAMEILINNSAIGACIREAKTFLLPGIIQTGKKLGMQLMDDALMELLKNGVIAPREAYERSDVKGPFASFLEEQ